MKKSELVRKYLSERHMMQLATVSGGQPWCCTVYFVVDDALNLYWASLPTRRHSQEIAEHSKVAVAIPVKFVNGEKVVGIQVEGTAEEVRSAEVIKPIAEQYAEKFYRDTAWVQDFSDRKTGHRLYKLTPKSFVLFDELHFPDDPRQEITI